MINQEHKNEYFSFTIAIKNELTLNIFHSQFGSCLSMLSGLGQMGWIVYKYMASRVFAGGEEQPAGAAIAGDVEQQMVEEIAEVVMALVIFLFLAGNGLSHLSALPLFDELRAEG